jgi:type II secretory pathway component GspD/PulD (secretin)
VVAPEVSSISSSSVQISENVNASIINSRSATTTVTVQDGHTIIIGGLITSSNDERETKVPFFGDIPFLGYLFKTTEKVKNRTELLIILTPEVLRTVNQADKVTAHQTKQLTLPKSIQSDAFRDTTFDPERVRPEADNKGNNTGLQGAKTPAVPIPESLEGDEPGEVRPWVTVVPKPSTKGPAK